MKTQANPSANLRRFLSIVLVGWLLANSARADDALKPSIRGSETYREAFKSMTDHKVADALQLASKLDASKPAESSERSAIEAWADFYRCRFDSATKKTRAALDADPKQPLALLINARLLASENSIEKADDAAKAAAEADPENPAILWWAIDSFAPRQVALREKWINQVIALGGSPEVPNCVETAKELLDYCKKLGDREVEVVAKGTRGELPFQTTMMGGPRITVPLADGRQQAMTLDTGAGMTMMPRAAVNVLKTEQMGRATAYAVTGRVSFDRVLMDVFSIGSLELNAVPAIVSPQNALLGMNLFHNHVLVIDFVKKRIVVHSDHAEFEKEWTDTIKGTDPIPFRMFKNSIYASATFKTAGEKPAIGGAFFDTGAGPTLLATSFAAEWSRESNVKVDNTGAQPVVGAAGAQRMQTQAISNVTIEVGNITFQSNRMPVMDIGASRNVMGIDFSALVGIHDMVKRTFFIVDCPKRQLYIGPPL